MPNFTICLTGHSGYIGSHFIEFLKQRGFTPFLIGREAAPTQSILGCKVAKPWKSIVDLKRQLQDLDTPIIINIAGFFASNHKTANFSELVESNFGYPISIMEAVSDISEAKMVNIGTSWEFDDLGNKFPSNLYAQLKACNSSVADWYASHHDIRTINLKLNDTFGGNDNRSKLMPMLKSHYTKGTIAKLNYSSQLINLLHISDVCEGLLSAARRTFSLSPHSSETAFLYAKETVSLKELVHRINSSATNTLQVHFKGEQPSGHRLREIWRDAPRLKGWQPKLDLNQALSEYFLR